MSESYIFNPDSGELIVAEPGILRGGKLVAEWCDSGQQPHDASFHSYPQDDECSCGVRKHHVHGVCGHITQVG
jgi:hypothetical protein